MNKSHFNFIGLCTIRYSYKQTDLLVKDLCVLGDNIYRYYKHIQVAKMLQLQMMLFLRFHYTYLLGSLIHYNNNIEVCHYSHLKICKISSGSFLSNTIKSNLKIVKLIPKLKPKRNLIDQWLQCILECLPLLVDLFYKKYLKYFFK